MRLRSFRWIASCTSCRSTRNEDMTRGVPVLDPKIHLVGATPRTLARALLRQPHLRPPRVAPPVVGDELPVEEAATDEPGDGVAHLDDGV